MAISVEMLREGIQVSSLPFYQLKLQGLGIGANQLEVWKMNLVAYSPLTDVLYVGVGKKIRAYSLANWNESANSTVGCLFELQMRPSKDDATINFLYYGCLGGIPVLGAVDSEGNVVLWNEPECQRSVIVSLNNDCISSWGMATSEKHRLLAVSANDHLIKVWSLNDDNLAVEERFSLAGHHHNIPCISFSPCGRFLISVSIDGTLWIWNVFTRQPVYSTNVTPERDWGWSCLPIALEQIALDSTAEGSTLGKDKFITGIHNYDTGWEQVQERNIDGEQPFSSIYQQLERNNNNFHLMIDAHGVDRIYGALPAEQYDSILNHLDATSEEEEDFSEASCNFDPSFDVSFDDEAFDDDENIAVDRGIHFVDGVAVEQENSNDESMIIDDQEGMGFHNEITISSNYENIADNDGITLSCSNGITCSNDEITAPSSSQFSSYTNDSTDLSTGSSSSPSESDDDESLTNCPLTTIELLNKLTNEFSTSDSEQDDTFKDTELIGPIPDFAIFATSHSSLALFLPPRRQSVIYHADYITTSLTPRQRRLLTPIALRNINRLSITLWIRELSCLITASHSGLTTLSRVSMSAENGRISLQPICSLPLDEGIGAAAPAVPTSLMAGLCLRANSSKFDSLGLSEGGFQLFVVHVDGTVAVYEIEAARESKSKFLFI
jgi:hypothetical protein